MLRIVFLFSCILFFCVGLKAQTAPNKYWVQFIDKAGSSFSLAHPEQFLSSKSIERRNRFGIGFDMRDLPLSQNYIHQVLSLGSCSLHQKSKWFNAITIVTEDTALINMIRQLSFVRQVRSVHRYSYAQELELKKKSQIISMQQDVTESSGCDEFPEYGKSFRQIEMMNGQLLHALNLTGIGVDIAQLDAGWNMTDRLPVFEKLRSEGRIKMVHDFVFHDDNTIFTSGDHGTYVLSTMAAYLPDSLIGTAPDANYYLFRTEEEATENIVEEDNWVAAAEMCDSIGIDIINSSLGYSLFDNSEVNHSYADMDGNTTRCSIAADIAAEKGILVVNSAGNSGDDAWHYITAPSDGDSVLCVGGVDKNRHHAAFSGYGPASDGDVKPNVVTMGQSTFFAGLDSTIISGNGTSFSAPIMSGMAACLYQAFPEKRNMEFFHAIEQSASEFPSSSDSLGYGIPDMLKAFILLGGTQEIVQGDLGVTVYPNPCKDVLKAILMDVAACDIQYEIYALNGQRVFEGLGIIRSEDQGILILNDAIKSLSSEKYILHLSRGGRHSVVHFEKI